MFCVKRLNCGLCAGKNATSVLEPCFINLVKKPSSVNSLTGMTTPCLSSDRDPSEPTCIHSGMLDSPYLYSEEKASDMLFNLSSLFYPTEEELPSFNQCGDSCYSNILNIGALELKHRPVANEKHVGCFPLSHSRPYAEGPLLVSLADITSHRIASLKQVLDYHESPFTCKEALRRTDSVSDNFPIESITLPDFVSDTVCDMPHAWTSVTANYEHTQTQSNFEKGRKHAGRADHSVNFRPRAPTRFSGRTSLAHSTSLYTTDSLVADPNLGHTSTTHEIRWTIAEQETFSTDHTINPDLPMLARCPLPEAHLTESRYTFRTASNVLTTTNSPTIAGALNVHDRKLWTKCKSISPVNTGDNLEDQPSSVSGRMSTVLDCTLAPFTDERQRTAHSLNDVTFLGELSTPHACFAPVSAPQCSPICHSELDVEGVKSWTVKRSLINHAPTCHFSCSTSDERRDSFIVCTRCSAARCRQKRCSTQTAIESFRIETSSHEPLQSLSETTGRQIALPINFIIMSPPVFSEPPSTRIRIIRPNDNLTSLCVTVNSELLSLPSAKSSKSVLMHYHMTPLSVKQYPVSSAVNFEPFEHLEPDQSVKSKRRSKNRRSSRLDRLDVNGLEHLVSQESQTSAGDLTGRLAPLEPSYCVYVEILLCRDLASVPRPGSLTESEARSVHTFLNRKLRSAVATQFLPQANAITHPKRYKNASERKDALAGLSHRNESVSKPSLIFKDNPVRSIAFKRLLSRAKRVYKRMPNHVLTGISSCSSAFVFTRGPKQVQPPKQWWSHVDVNEASVGRSIAAWKLDGFQTYVGGLVNYGHHLKIVVSSNDGRLGIVHQQAYAVLCELIRKGTRYVNEGGVFDGKYFGPTDSVRIFIQSSVLARLISTSEMDLASTVGLEASGVAVSLLSENCIGPFSKAKDIVVVSTTNSQGVIHLDHLLACVRRLRELHRELLQTVPRIERHVMPVETSGYLLNKIRREPSKLLVVANEFFAHCIGARSQDTVTSYHGVLSHCIRPNAYCPEELYPRASDPDAYKVFKQLFEPILKNLGLVHNSLSQPPTRYVLPSHLSLNLSSLNVLSYRVRICRNLRGFGFSPVMTNQDFEKVEKLCRDALISWKEEGGVGHWYRLAVLKKQNPQLYHTLQRKQLLMPEPTVARKSFGSCRFWPHGRSIYVAPSGSINCDLVVQINGDDHLRVVCVDWTGKHPLVAYNRAFGLMHWLDSRLKFSKSARWGFLSPLPSNVGTGLKITCCLKVVNMEKMMRPLERVCDRYKLQSSSALPRGSPALCHLSTLSPRSSLGKTEADLMINFMHALQEFCENCQKCS